jgi:hypothetical protein
VYRLSHPSVAAATAPTAEALEKHPIARSGSGYSWRKPFLRRPPSTTGATEEICAKKLKHTLLIRQGKRIYM